MQLLKLAPLSQSYDFFIAILFCYLPPFIILLYCWFSSRSGCYQKRYKNGVPYWIRLGKDVPLHKTAQFPFAMLWIFLGSIFFWLFLWPTFSDVWFIE
jgi:hypothetical protein